MFNRLLQKEGNIIWSSIPPNDLIPLNQVAMQAQPAIPLSWEGVKAGHVLFPRQAALNPDISWEGGQAVQALFPRQTRVSVPAKVSLVLQWRRHRL